MDPRARIATLVLTLLLAPSSGRSQTPADAGRSTPPTAVADAEDRPFEEPQDWRFELGTDTSFTLSDEGVGSTNESNDGTSNFDAVHMRLYARLRRGDKVELLVDLFSADARDPSIYGLYLRLKPDRRFGVRMGILPLVVGGWQDRAYPQRQPLIGQPLLSQYLLPLRTGAVPASGDELLSQRGRRAEASYSLGRPGGGGALALYYEHCWNPGLELFGQLGRLRYRAAVVAGPPGAPLVHVRDHVSGPAFEGRLTWTEGEWLQLGTSWARGPYLDDRLDELLPSRRAGDYDQQVLGTDVRLRTGRIEVNAEYAWSGFDSPFVAERLDIHAGYGELALRLADELKVAGRYSLLRHGEIATSDGRRSAWEAAGDRLELGVVQRVLDRHLAFKAGWQRTWLDTAPRVVEDVVAAQAAISY